jgi:monoamine oxidase
MLIPEFHGDTVLVTVPATVASSIDFKPKLSTKKWYALRTAAYSAATKVLMVFETPFWERENEGKKGGSILTDLNVRQIYYPQVQA